LSTHLGSADLERLYAAMLRIRIFEDTVHQLFLRNEIEGTTHLCQGQEAVSVGVCDILEPGDTVAATYRGHGACVAMGVEPGRLFAEFLGRATGVNGGRGGSMNVVDLERGVLGCFGIVGGSIGAGTGAALAAQLHGDGTAAVAFFGDGAVNQAYFHECLNFSGVRQLPILYACENNLYGEWTPMGKVTAGGRILPRAEAYGIPGVQVDGNDVLAVREAAEKALVTARAGNGPTLIEFLTYRHKGHSRVDPGKYRPKEEVDAWLARDPIPRFATGIEPDAAERIRDEVEREIADALEAARAAPFPDPEQAASATKGAP
jgi:acetoin:2,6-dichlorophenolindophenol oxidoreductase subunit alpha